MIDLWPETNYNFSGCRIAESPVTIDDLFGFRICEFGESL